MSMVRPGVGALIPWRSGAPARTHIPLIPANAGTQIIENQASKNLAPGLRVVSPFYLGPGIRRDERKNDARYRDQPPPSARNEATAARASPACACTS